jgi:hypothetical protein
MEFGEFRDAIRTGDLRRHVNDHLLFPRPHLFAGRDDLYNEFRHEISSALGVPGRAVAFVGSAQLGFSLNPEHLGRVFGAHSDVDIVIVSAPHFDEAWLELNALTPTEWKLDKLSKERMDRCRDDVFWGYVRLWQLPRRLRIAREWIPIFDRLSSDPRFGPRKMAGRLYRTWSQVEASYALSLRALRVPSEVV